MSFDGVVWVSDRLTAMLEQPVNCGDAEAYELQVLLLLEYLWEAKLGNADRHGLVRQWTVFATSGNQQSDLSLAELSQKLAAFREQLGV